MARSGIIRIGVSGWSYPSWRGSFYPSDLPQKDELAYAARRFSAIEINATFYRLQNPDSFGRWRDATPDDFVFAVRLRLREVDVTSDVVYCRLHGSEQLYASGYDGAALDRWAQRVRDWACGGEPKDAERVLGPTKPRVRGRDVFLFFDNDAMARAPLDAAALIEQLARAGTKGGAPKA
ncbi:MAG TPA: DUF72 domain-containing protein [Roseiarcus sp.]|jgi:uncharacterized protein YecE (DUF72 family)